MGFGQRSVEAVVTALIKRLYHWFFDLLHDIAQWAFGLLGKQLTDKLWQSIRQFVQFCLVGVTNFAISYGIHCLTLFIIGDRMDTTLAAMIASTFGFIISVLNSFYLNNRFVFRNKGASKRELLLSLLKTYVSYGSTGLLLNYILLYLLVDLLNVSGYIAPLIILCITTPINFLLNKFWAFRAKRQTANPNSEPSSQGEPE